MGQAQIFADILGLAADTRRREGTEIRGQPSTHPPCSRTVAAGSYAVPRRTEIGGRGKTEVRSRRSEVSERIKNLAG